MRRLSPLVAPAIAALLVVPSAASEPPSHAGAPALAAVLGERVAPDWTREGPSRGFDADNLWEYIDGDADRYVDAGLLEMRTATYRYRGELEAVVDVYRMAEPEAARSILGSESTGGWEAVELGDEARQSDLALVFCAGQDFVRIVAYDMTPETTSSLRALGSALAARLDATVSRGNEVQEVEP